jgi:hypothetical protein
MIHKFNVKNSILREIFRLQPQYPSDDILTNYNDFLKVRDLLHLYRFNPVVFERLLDLTLEKWNTNKRISRISLIETTCRYLNILRETVNRANKEKFRPDENSALALNVRRKLFLLFQKSIDDSTVLCPAQIEIAQTKCNNMLIGQPLPDDAIQWLLDNRAKHPCILNRIMRYPEKSKLINQWIKTHFEDDIIRIRRTESISRLLDFDADYELPLMLLKEDFESINELEENRFNDYKYDARSNMALAREMNEIFPDNHNLFYTDLFGFKYFGGVIPQPEIIRRPYRVPIQKDHDLCLRLPDFDKLRDEYLSNLAFHQRATMIWATFYSRLDAETKNVLYRKYYHQDTLQLLVRISKREGNLGLLQWMLQQQ